MAQLLVNQTQHTGNQRLLTRGLTLNEFFDSLRVNRIVALRRCLPLSITLSLFVPAVLHNQRDNQLLGLL